MNAYETGAQKVIPAVLIYARHPSRPKTLMLHRISKAQDYHQGKWNGLGGKFEKGESPETCAAREFFEEAGLEIAPDRFTPLGLLYFPNFKAHKNEDWSVVVLDLKLHDSELARVRTESSEGKLSWVENTRLLSLNLWPGDHVFLPLVLKREPFIGTFWYQDQALVRHQLQKLSSAPS